LDQYNAAQVSKKWFVNTKGENHVASTYLGDRRENVYVRDMFNCYFKSDTAACTRVTNCSEKNAAPTAGGCLHHSSSVIV